MNKSDRDERVENILMRKRKSDLLMPRPGEDKDLKLLTSLRNSNKGPVISRKKPKLPEDFDFNKLNKALEAINELSDKLLKQREIEYVEMNKDMAIQLMENHNNRLFFINPISIKINDDMEDKAIKIKYRR